MAKYFGTDGVRGDASTFLTSDLAYRIGRFIGQYPSGRTNKILLGRDTRISGITLDQALIDGLIKSGAIVYELGVTTTPSISYLVENNDFDFGIMISASHNPFTDNGIKIFAPSGEKLSSDIEELIEQYIDSDQDYLPIFAYEDSRLISASNLLDDYLRYVASKAQLSGKKFNILLDCAHGSASVVAKKLFKDLLNQNVTLINDTYDGTDINLNCGSTHLKMIKDKMKNGHYDVGFAFDGDADRLMTIADNNEVIDGDFFMYMMAKNMKKHNLLNENAIVVTTMSNLGLKKAIKKQGIKYLEVGVGDKYVQQCLKENHLSLGGEQSGHVIFYQDLNTGCGLLSAVHMLNLMADENLSSSQLMQGMKLYPQLLINVKVNNKEKVINDIKLNELIKRIEEDLKDDGRILVRPSGTEQLIRVMVEASDLAICQKNCFEIVEYINFIK